jgi:hypothetical protein
MRMEFLGYIPTNSIHVATQGKTTLPSLRL